MDVVEVIDLSRSFGKIKALENISFSVAEGELFGLIGPDGAGKTTLLRILVSLLLPDSGTARIKGFDVVKDYRRIRQMAGYMPGRFSLYQDLTVEENLNFFARVFGTSIKENYHLIRDIYIQIEPFKKRKARDLSGGMKQKLALSCALIHRPEILFLDEPTTGVDAVSRKEFWDLLATIKSQGIAVLVSTPYMDEATRCDKVALIQKAKILSLDTPSKISKSFSRPLYSVRSDGSGFLLLKELRKVEYCHSAWLFGQEIHISLKNETDVQDFEVILLKLSEVAEYHKIKPGIEDSFIELMNEENGA